MAEMGEWLRQRGVEPEQVEVVVDHLASSGALDDVEFARRFAEDKRELQSWGSERIRTALLERGVAPSDVDEGLGGVDAESELERAASLLRERAAPLAEPSDRQRALGLLARRGYDADLAYEAILRAGSEQPPRHPSSPDRNARSAGP